MSGGGLQCLWLRKGLWLLLTVRLVALGIAPLLLQLLHRHPADVDEQELAAKLVLDRVGVEHGSPRSCLTCRAIDVYACLCLTLVCVVFVCVKIKICLFSGGAC